MPFQGTGFATTFTNEDRQTKVEVGGVECLIESQSATEIVCETQMNDKLREKENSNFYKITI